MSSRTTEKVADSAQEAEHDRSEAMPQPRESAVRRVLHIRELGILAALLGMFVGLSVGAEGFLTATNLINVARQISTLGIISMGMTFVIISGDFDLSVGSVYGMSGMITAFSMVHGVSIWLSMLIGIASGTLVGLFNGLVTTYGRLPSFITTLGTMNMAQGIALIITNGLAIHVTSYDVADPALPVFFFLGGGRLFGVLPMQAVFFAGIALLSAVLLHRTVLGVYFYAVGGSSRTARACGINVAKTKTTAFTILGGLSAFGGILSLAFIKTIQPTAGGGMLFDAFSAVIIGGTAISGGAGTIWGTVIGTVLIGVMRNGLVLLGVSAFWQVFIIGVVILVAVGVDKWMTRGLTRGEEGA